MPKVSVIIPIYNVERYIERCLYSLFSQTLEDIEYIFIDDATPDKSIEILKEVLTQYPKRLSQVKIIHHQQNLGIAAARTTGIKTATGEYIIHCDPDDFIEKEMYYILYKIAEEYDAEISGCDFFSGYNSKDKVFPIHNYNPKYLIKEWFNSKADNSSLCNKLIKRKLLIDNNIFPYPDINNGEDLGLVVRALYYANKYIHVSLPLYHYCKRIGSLTHTYNKKRFLQERKLVEKISFFFEKKGYDIFCNNLKFDTKIKFRTLYIDNKQEWFNIFSECHKDILKFKGNPLKVRLLWYMALCNWNVYNFMRKYINILN